MPHVIVLAAGKGSRMNSELPKVLTPVRGVPMIRRVLETASSLCARPTVVVGHRAGDVMAVAGEGPDFVVQQEQRGTGHAVACALEAFGGLREASVVVLPGDHPFVTAGTIRAIVEAREREDAAVALATVRLPDFADACAQFEGCGRIVRGTDGGIAAIIERKDATPAQAAITEVNVSYYCFRAGWLKGHVRSIVSRNAAGESYLTDLVAAAFAQGERIVGVPLADVREGLGINTLEQLRMAETA